jgi:hypothetical protein
MPQMSTGMLRAWLAGCLAGCLAAQVGVSNFNASRVRGAAQRLGAAGVPLASNQVQYSLLYRAPERNGVLEACRENGGRLFARAPRTIQLGCFGSSDGLLVEWGRSLRWLAKLSGELEVPEAHHVMGVFDCGHEWHDLNWAALTSLSHRFHASLLIP